MAGRQEEESHFLSLARCFFRRFLLPSWSTATTGAEEEPAAKVMGEQRFTEIDLLGGREKTSLLAANMTTTFIPLSPARVGGKRGDVNYDEDGGALLTVEAVHEACMWRHLPLPQEGTSDFLKKSACSAGDKFSFCSNKKRQPDTRNFGEASSLLLTVTTPSLDYAGLDEVSPYFTWSNHCRLKLVVKCRQTRDGFFVRPPVRFRSAAAPPRHSLAAIPYEELEYFTKDRNSVVPISLLIRVKPIICRDRHLCAARSDLRDASTASAVEAERIKAAACGEADDGGGREACFSKLRQSAISSFSKRHFGQEKELQGMPSHAHSQGPIFSTQSAQRLQTARSANERRNERRSAATARRREDDSAVDVATSEEDDSDPQEDHEMEAADEESGSEAEERRRKKIPKIAQTENREEEAQEQSVRFVVTAKNNDDVERIREKVRRIQRLPPQRENPGGYKLVSLPKDDYEWNRISFLVIPGGDSAVDSYDPKLLCSLLANVMIIEEPALDLVLRLKGEPWPGRHHMLYSNFELRFETRRWKSTIARLKVAQEGLFDSTEFCICSGTSTQDSHLCKLLIQLGGGMLVADPHKAGYIIVTDESCHFARSLKTSLIKQKNEDQVASTHGEQHCNLVTPRFLYDCVRKFKILRPSADRHHLAFTSKRHHHQR